MPMAAGHICSKSDTSGSANEGRPPLTSPTNAMPKRFSPASHETVMPVATVTSEAGTRGRNRCKPSCSASMASASRIVGTDACGR